MHPLRFDFAQDRTTSSSSTNPDLAEVLPLPELPRIVPLPLNTGYRAPDHAQNRQHHRATVRQERTLPSPLKLPSSPSSQAASALHLIFTGEPPEERRQPRPKPSLFSPASIARSVTSRIIRIVSTMIFIRLTDFIRRVSDTM